MEISVKKNCSLFVWLDLFKWPNLKHRLTWTSSRMSKFHFVAVFTVFVVSFVLKIPLLCDSCQNDFGSYQEMLENRQQVGKFPRDAASELSRKWVISNMECLDICLRNAACDFFELKQLVRVKKWRRYWVCAIKRRINSIDTKLVYSRRWIHFNVSSHYLHEVGRSTVIL